MGSTLEKVKGLGRGELAGADGLLGREELEAIYIKHFSLWMEGRGQNVEGHTEGRVL